MEKYEKLSKIGEGSYGLVIKCRHKVRQRACVCVCVCVHVVCVCVLCTCLVWFVGGAGDNKAKCVQGEVCD